MFRCLLFILILLFFYFSIVRKTCIQVILTSILNFFINILQKNRGKLNCWWLVYGSTSVTQIFEGLRRVVSIWNFVRLYRLIMESRNKILGSGSTSCRAYPYPLVALFGIFSLWRPATTVKTNEPPEKINMLCVWMRYIDWYLNWPGRTFISWDMIYLLVPCDVDMVHFFEFQNFFFTFWVIRPWKSRFWQN